MILLQFQTILLPYKLWVSEEKYLNKECNLENYFLLTAFISVPSLIPHRSINGIPDSYFARRHGQDSSCLESADARVDHVGEACDSCFTKNTAELLYTAVFTNIYNRTV